MEETKEYVKLSPRKVPNKDERYMGMAFMASGLSKDPHTQVGSFIISSSGKPLGWGYNGIPSSIDDNAIDWNRPHKYDFIKHAEVNAISHTEREKLVGGTIYVTALPCPKCMLEIADAKLARVVYLDHPKTDKCSSLSNDALISKTHEIAALANVKIEKFNGSLVWLDEKVSYMKNNSII